MGRRRWRLGYLNRFFDNEIAKVDENFLPRLKASNRAHRDEKRLFRGALLFPETGDDAYYHEYPTIYHLRYALITRKKQFDIRLIYLALHHMIKYRGNFLDTTPVSAFDAKAIDLTNQFVALNSCYSQLEMDFDFQFDLDHIEQIQKLLLDKQSKKDRANDLNAQLPKLMGNRVADEKRKVITKEFVKALVGNKLDLAKILNLSVSDAKSWQFYMTDEDVDETIANLVDELDENRKQIAQLIQMTYSQVMMYRLLHGNQLLSGAMVERYDQHAKHWASLKKLLPALDESQRAAIIHAYTAYTGHSRTDHVLPADEFGKKVKAILSKYKALDGVTEILQLIDNGEFMPKQRDAVNGVIPHQLHQRELELIIQNQQQYYPFLATKANPRDKETMIEQLLSFRVPYYAGPLIDRDFVKMANR